LPANQYDSDRIIAVVTSQLETVSEALLLYFFQIIDDHRSDFAWQHGPIESAGPILVGNALRRPDRAPPIGARRLVPPAGSPTNGPRAAINGTGVSI
jgi:hypothetical protein